MIRLGRLLTVFVSLAFVLSLSNPGVIHEGLPPEAGVLEAASLPARPSPTLPDVTEPVDPDVLETPSEDPMAEVLVEVPEVPPEDDPDMELAIAVPVPPPEDPPEEPPEDPPEEPPATPSGIEVPMGQAPKVDVLFCLDTTGSMSDEIYVAKEAILDIAALVATGNPVPEVRYGLVIYRDLEDAYVTLVHDFMDATELAVILANVSARGGGDYEESVSEALHRSVHDVSWDMEETSRAIYLIGDAPPHTDYDNGFDHLQAARDASERGIIVHAIGCSGISGNEEEFQDVVDITGGTFVYLTYSGSGGGSSGGYPGGCYDGELEVYTCGADEGSGSGSGTGAGGSNTTHEEDADGDYANDLDDQLCRLIQNQARSQGVKYEGDGEETVSDGE